MKHSIIRRHHSQFNPHKFWVYFLSCFVVALAVELLCFSWFFTQTVKVLDAQAVPTLETNGATIKSMEDRLDTIDEAIKERINR